MSQSCHQGLPSRAYVLTALPPTQHPFGTQVFLTLERLAPNNQDAKSWMVRHRRWSHEACAFATTLAGCHVQMPRPTMQDGASRTCPSDSCQALVPMQPWNRLQIQQ